MEKRLVIFAVLSLTVMIGFFAVNYFMFPPQPAADRAQQNRPDRNRQHPENNDGDDGEADADANGEAPPASDGSDTDLPPDDGEDSAPPPDDSDEPAAAAGEGTSGTGPPMWLSAGSLDGDKFPFLVTYCSRGGTIARIELSAKDERGRFKYRDLDDGSGYFGHLMLTDENGGGCRVNVVGDGTPAAAAGIRAGDVIKKFNGEPVKGRQSLLDLLAKTRPEDTVEAEVSRRGQSKKFKLTLTRRPLEIVRPEPLDKIVGPVDNYDVDNEKFHPLSCRLTVGALDEDGELKATTIPLNKDWRARQIVGESPGIEFRLTLDDKDLEETGLSGPIEIVKRFRLFPIESSEAGITRPYHLDIDVRIENHSGSEQQIAYRLEGPNGLPTEGWWYSNKISQSMFRGAGARDVVIDTSAGGFEIWTCASIYNQAIGSEKPDEQKLTLFRATDSPATRTVQYVGVDAQYFSAVLIPERSGDAEGGVFQRLDLFAVKTPGEEDKKSWRRTNVSFGLTSEPEKIAAGGTMERSFTLFAGPKEPELLAEYGLGETVYYGWFGFVSQPLVAILDFFYWITGGLTYALAIILLTVLVRSCLLPISLKAAKNAQMMQALAPEMRAIAEKHKDDLEKRGQAQRELYRKYNFNPLSGCLPMFLQLPIFLGLYRALSVDIAIRDQPLIPGIGWASNLAGPDMLWYWRSLLAWDYITAPTGWLGPYFNLLPMITVVLFLVQQKLFTPPATDDQTRMQQKMMMFMTVMIGVMFFKVPAGLCLYFITSSMWGICERKLLRKVVGSGKEPPPPPTKKRGPSISGVMDWLSSAASFNNGNGNGAAAAAAKKKKKNKGRR